MIAAGTKVFQVAGGEASVLTNAPDGLQVRGLRCSADGRRLGVVLGEQLAVAMAYPSRETEGSATYGDRARSTGAAR